MARLPPTTPGPLVLLALLASSPTLPGCGGRPEHGGIAGDGDTDTGTDSDADALVHAGEALDYLAWVMDAWHGSLDVYTDISAPGNHFTCLGRMSSEGEGDADAVHMVQGVTTDPHSGCDSVEARLESRGDNWGGWYFLEGLLQGEDTVPTENWGEAAGAGLDLTGATRLVFWARGAAGGEKVVFFAGGVGRDPESGQPTEPYPGSFPRTCSTKDCSPETLGTSWQRYEIDLTGLDLSYVLGGFGWVASALDNPGDVTFYLDDIAYDLDRTDQPRFLRSYQVECTDDDFDRQSRNVAFTYDDALAILAWLARGEEDDLRRASLVGEALVYAMDHDRYYDDGRLRNAYQAGDLALPPGWTPNGRSETVRMPGWWSDDGRTWLEDEYQVSTYTGSMAWAALALHRLYLATGDGSYLDASVRLAEWVARETPEDGECGGFDGGYEGWEPTSNDPEHQARELAWRSTEHNIDLEALFGRLSETTGDSTWQELAGSASGFVDHAFDDEEGHYWTGTTSGCELDRCVVPLDVQAWAQLLRGPGDGDSARAVEWARDALASSGDCTGFQYSVEGGSGECPADTADTGQEAAGDAWYEGTAHMVLALRSLGLDEEAETYMQALEEALGPNPDGRGSAMTATCEGALPGGFGWSYQHRPHVGATAWFVLAELGGNPLAPPSTRSR